MRGTEAALERPPGTAAAGVDREIGDQGLSLASEIVAWREGLQPVRIPGTIERIIALGSGSAYHAALASRPAFAAAGIPMTVLPADAFTIGDRPPDSRTLILAVSHSEETPDVLAALRRARVSGAPVMALVNAAGSPVSREADFVLRLLAGPESDAVSTKTYTSQLLNLLLLAHEAGRVRGVFGGADRAVEGLPALAEAVLCRDTYIRNCARKYHAGYRFLFVGRRGRHGTALEASLKMKEFCPESASGASAVETLDESTLRHVDHRTVVVVIAPGGDHSARLIPALRQARARGAIVITVATEGDRKLADLSNHVFEIPPCGDFWSPLLEVLPLQLLARHRGRELRTN